MNSAADPRALVATDPRLRAARPDLADERLRGIVDALRFVRGTERRVVAPSAPLRREPRGDAPLDTEALAGEAVTVFDEDEGFAWVQLRTDCYVGYVPSDALGPAGPDPTHRVSALRTFVFPGPDIKLPPLAFLPLGAGVTPLDEKAGFVRLAGTLPGQDGGWVFGRHLGRSDAVEPDPVAVAERLTGTPYLWGGRTSLGLDCSGLIQLVFALAGWAVPRDSHRQEATIGVPLPVLPDLSGLRRGDLVFWRGHVGLMRDGDTLLHANAHHMAVASEPLAEAERRIGAGGGPITSIRRPDGGAGPPPTMA